VAGLQVRVRFELSGRNRFLLMEPSALADRLAAHRTLASVPREELEWLVRNGHERIIGKGEVLTERGGPVPGFYVVLDGHLSIRLESGMGLRTVMEWRGGDVTGMLPYSRIKSPPADVVAEEQTFLFAVAPENVARMARECPQLTTVLVHVMLDRARVFSTNDLLDEKTMSLGRIAAGLAHELNNPASAVVRSAKTLVEQLSASEQATRRFCGLNLSDAECATIEALRARRSVPAETLSPLERADRQDAVADWLSARRIDGVDVEPLAEAGFVPEDLDGLASAVGSERLKPVLGYISINQNILRLATEIHTAASRIHTLVAAVKGFTYVNQQATLQPIAIDRGLSDTVTVLRSKAKEQSVNVELQLAPNLPAVDGYGGELNQVWANLVDNAIDATPGGHVRVSAEAANGKVVVRVVDDGPGIPPDVAKRIFDPFFTTKGVGKGTGLGLDIARRILQRHQGVIDVTSGSSGTEFRVTLPASPSTPCVPSH
jgi:signal transduction histidine kinase